ncbi:DNA-directed RNA polymerase subunit delta [Aerococcus suis]|uniref:Probable DNA-directed RNA polymerase subunit delta n=1 Tax=Aerococcus suis TaxID=371602 RepID=A0A1W1YRU8_9LACT|nr:DNA-directed RNA polymerase subunit delta [Aerococcus suis]MCI7240597.1 DNA-directed RNA polymerase subunit delta [Aerococcus suis]MDD7759103.1 DNA-directed RNA polymerase subunit delta [Aerococcus suis]MDY4646551.1 DNA-directed RNA polymerase subunit delta [Aerococcus suis]SMC38930.1 DNA-directed RNA polymerase subunit delta [Aerococcus suis]
MKLKKLDGLNKNQIAMVEVAYALLEETNVVHSFDDLLVAIQDYLEMPQDELEEKMALFYTEMNADGRFISLGDNRWGLREWYPVDSIDEEIISTIEDDEITKKHKGRRKKSSSFASTEKDLIDYGSDDPEDEDLDDQDDDYDQDDDDDELEEYSSDLSSFSNDDDDDDDLEDGLEGDLTELSDDEDDDDDM